MRLHSEIGDIPPAELEASYYRHWPVRPRKTKRASLY
jgi:hypothetical protein